MNKTQLKAWLQQEAEPRYAAFASSLLPDNTHPLLGVRLPKLRRTARRLAAEHGLAFLRTLPPKSCSFEELMLCGMLIGYVKEATWEQRTAALDRLVPRLDNWSLCDSCCATYSFARQERERTWAWLQPYLLSAGEYTRRFGVVMLLNHFLQEPAWAARCAEVLPQVRGGQYYADMAVAWCACELALRHPALAPALLAAGTLPEPARKLAFRKLRESRRRPEPKK